MTRLIVFAKAPVAGQVKTRLAQTLGERGAATLAARMLEHTLSTAVSAEVGPVELCGTPPGHPLLVEAAKRHGVALSAQFAGDLGRRMHAAFAARLSQTERVLIIGTDCPSMTPALIRRAATALADVDAAFVPAEDGGYVLIGLRRNTDRLFNDVPWSTSLVMELTRERMRGLGWQWWESDPLPDIDEVAALATLPGGWQSPSLTEAGGSTP